MTTEEPDGATSIPVDPATDVGSERLAQALAVRDVPAIGQALRHDYVVVPVVRGPDGESQVAVVGTGADDGSYELCLFSSAATFASFVADGPTKEFALQRGDSLVSVIEQHRALLTRVMFDPAGPHPVQASVEDVLEILRPRPTDDDVAWAAGTRPEAADRPGDRTVAIDLALTKDWAVIDLTDLATTEKQAAALVKQQLRGLPRSPMLRSQLTRWLVSSARAAAGAGGRFMAFFLRRNLQATVALNVTMYWHELGPYIGGSTHLEAITDRIRSGLRPDDELVGSQTAAGPFVRHTHVRRGAEEVGGQDVPVLVTDYWLQFADQRGLCLLSFTSPHLDLREHIHRLTDNIVVGAAWVTEPVARD